LAYINVYENPIAAFTMDPNPTTQDNTTINFYDESYDNIVSWFWDIAGQNKVIQILKDKFGVDQSLLTKLFLNLRVNGAVYLMAHILRRNLIGVIKNLGPNPALNSIIQIMGIKLVNGQER
jgi:hypothetical protein